MNISRYVRIVCFLLLLLIQQSSLLSQTCNNAKPPTFTVKFPLVRIPPNEEGVDWSRPDIWRGEDAVDDSIVVPNGRPVYALIVSGYASNKYLDEMMLYNFARHMMSQGAYVHYAWWNNLLAPYMERPLHHNQSEPGGLDVSHFRHFASGTEANSKALPGEDYQFLADAKLFLAAIRENNPNAVVVVAGHSMGGGAVVHLAQQSHELIDILAPIDPVGNRNFPFAGSLRFDQKDFNWTRWRVSRDNFLGYRKTEFELFSGCVPTGGWLSTYPPAPFIPDPFCTDNIIINNAPVITFGSRIVNLFHRYQHENLFPFDYPADYDFGHTAPPNGTTNQAPVKLKIGFCGFGYCDDVGGWPDLTSPANYGCCPSSDGVGWSFDGHGEIVGYRGPGDPVPLGVRFQTSPRCGDECKDKHWPARSEENGIFLNGSGGTRKAQLQALETLPFSEPWPHRPYNPSLCLVSSGLATLFFNMNKPPTAVAGPNQVIECSGSAGALVTLNATGSSDPDDDELEYLWIGPNIEKPGQIVQVQLPIGSHCITLIVKDPSGHRDVKKMMVKVEDKTGPIMNVSLSPNLLWPPNHKLIDINATVTATDLCSSVQNIVLHSIVASEGVNVVGSGNTSQDIAGANYNTHDLSFKLRAERSGSNQRRVYTVTYKATDNAGNSTLRSKEVIVENPSAITQRSAQPVMMEEVNKTFYSYISTYPNPFNAVTKIDYYVPSNGQVRLAIYNSIGQLVATPVNGLKQTGYHTVLFDGKELPSGVYTCSLITEVNSATHKMLLLK